MPNESKRTAYPKVKFVEAYQRITSFLGVLYHILKVWPRNGLLTRRRVREGGGKMFANLVVELKKHH